MLLTVIQALNVASKVSLVPVPLILVYNPTSLFITSA